MTTSTSTASTANASTANASTTVALLAPTVFQVITLTKKQQLAYEAATRANDALDLATSNNKTLQTFGLSVLKIQQLAKASAQIGKGQFTPACRLVDSWLSHEFGALIGNDQKSLSEYMSSAALKIAGLKAVKTIERKTLALAMVHPISEALLARLTLKG